MARTGGAAQPASPERDVPPRLSLRAIRKVYPSVVANDGIDLDVLPGQIHAVLGENGAGKSTLMKIIYGVTQPTEGELRWHGQPLRIDSPAQARRLGIGMVFQHFSLFESLTVAENVALVLRDAGSMDDLSRRIVEVGDRYGLSLDPRRHVHDLSVGERQRVEIARCLMREPRLLIMDEPTSVLTPQEADRLFMTLRQLKAEGCSILYISHKLAEIQALCDRATILRGGRVVGACDPARESPRSMAEMMIGQELSQPHREPVEATGPVRLEVDGLSTATGAPFATEIRDARFSVRAGEIFGIAGVAGSGQAELLLALSGEVRVAPASLKIDGKPAGGLGPAERRALGLALVPEERLGRGAVPALSLADNTVLTGWKTRGLVRGGWVEGAKATALAAAIIKRLGVKARGPADEAGSLSGGNLQKFIVGREISAEPRLLVVAQPTWGVDAGAAAAIHRELIGLAERGAAVLVISQDLDELFLLCDRLAVLYHGRLSPPRRTADTNVEQIGLLMGGMFEAAENADAA